MLDASGALEMPVAAVFLPLLEPSRYKAAWGGRASAKSYFFADLLIERCLTGTTRAVGIREVQKSLDTSVKQLLEDRIKHWGVHRDFNFLRSHIECPHDGIISFMGMQDRTAAAIRSLEGYDVAWGEEAQSLSQDSLTTLRPTMRKPGSELWFSWNPREEDDPVDEFFRGPKGAKWTPEQAALNLPPRTTIVRSNWEDNPWFGDDSREEMEYDRRRDPDKYKHVWLGEYLALGEARVFRNWRIEEFEAPEDSRFFLGADWGFGDPSCLVRCFFSGHTLYVDYEAYKINCPIVRLPELFDTVPGSRKWPIRADSARPETIDYMRSHGFPRMTASVKGKGSVEDGVEFLKSFDIVVHPRCRHTTDELSLYSYRVDKKTNEVLPILEDKQNHIVDSIRYACEGERLAPRTIKIPAAARDWARGQQPRGDEDDAAAPPFRRRLVVPRTRAGRIVIRKVV